MQKSTTVFGIDFTSAPSSRKPITFVRARFDGGALLFEELVHLHGFEEFEALLATPGPWVAGIDFPFGQSRRLIKNVGWPHDWAGYVRQVSMLDRTEFRKMLEDYKRDRAPGDKHHKRACDALARSQSPQTLYGTPVGLMFYEGAPRLLKAGVCLPYHRHSDDSRVVLEAYPGVAARRLIGDKSYKSDRKPRQTPEQHRARQELLARLTGDEGELTYGFSIDAPTGLADDPSGDELDALICTVQAAWGFSRADCGYGVPPGADRVEGWISDPYLLDG